MNLPFTKGEHLADEGKVFEHFERFIGARKIPAGKKIVLIDFVGTGASLGIARELVSKFLGVPVETLALKIYAHRAGRRRPQPLDPTSHTVTIKGDFIALMQNQRFDGMAEYPSYTDHRVPMIRRPEYDLLGMQLLRFMQGDRDLHDQLAQAFPSHELDRVRAASSSQGSNQRRVPKVSYERPHSTRKKAFVVRK